MTITVRGYTGANNAHTSVATFTTTYASWTGAVPQTGDLVVVLGLATASGKTFACGDGTWTILSSDSNAATDSFTSFLAYHAYTSGDTAPTFTWTTGTAYNYLIFALYSSTGGNVVFDANGTVKVDTTSATSHTPNTASAATTDDASLVLTACRKQATGSGTLSVSTPCVNYTLAGSDAYTVTSTYFSNFVGAHIHTPVGSGTITPGAETVSASVAANLYHLLVKEVTPETSPSLELYGFSIPSPPLSGDTINSVTVAVS